MSGLVAAVTIPFFGQFFRLTVEVDVHRKLRIATRRTS